jgi:trans-aconitate methyltransferase
MSDALASGAVDYDRMWQTVYGDLQDLGPTHRHMVRLMRTALAPLHYRTVLDVGVGFGHNLPTLTTGRQLKRLVGVDVSEHALEHVRKRWAGDFVRLDITNERLPEQFDLVCAALILEHLDDDMRALRNLRSMTSKFLLVTTIGGSIETYGPWEQQMGHVRNYAPGELESKLSAAGFELSSLISWGFPFYSPIVRRLQNRMRASSELSRGSRLIARVLYPIFFLNSSRRGDLLIALAHPRQS